MLLMNMYALKACGNFSRSVLVAKNVSDLSSDTHSDQKANFKAIILKINYHLCRLQTKIAYGSNNSDPF